MLNETPILSNNLIQSALGFKRIVEPKTVMSNCNHKEKSVFNEFMVTKEDGSHSTVSKLNLRVNNEDELESVSPSYTGMHKSLQSPTKSGR